MSEPQLHCKFDSMVKVDDLKPFDRNRNRHSKEQIERLAKLLQFQGVRAPIVVAQDPWNCIAKGHGTAAAIKLLGWEYAPVVFQRFDNYDQLYAFVQSDNAIASWSNLDLSGINTDLPELGPFDTELLGLKGFEIEPSDRLGDAALGEKCETCGRKKKAVKLD